MNKKLISVAMCTFNGQKYLRSQLESILNQSVAPDEIVIVDDCSTDGTVALLEEYHRNYHNIRVVRNENTLGPNENFEKASRLCTGDLIFFSDQDDIWHPQKIKWMTDQIGAGDFLYSDAQIIDSEGHLKQESELDYHRVKPCPSNDPWYFFWNNCVSGHNLLVTKQLMLKAYPFPRCMMYDRWLALLASVGSGIKFLPKQLCQHRIHNTNYANNLKFDPVRIRMNKPRGIFWSSRKSRTYKRFEFHSELLERLIPSLPKNDKNKKYFELMFNHFNNFDKTFFNFNLFFSLYKIRNDILLNDKYIVKIKKFKKFSVGGMGHLLPFV